MKILGLESQSSVKKKLSVMIPKDVVQNAITHKMEEFQQRAKLPGFRKGRVPQSIIKNRFEKDIKYEAELDVIDKTIGDAIQQAKIKAVGSPVIEKMDYSADGDFTYTVVVENIPELDNIDFKRIEIKKLPTPSVTDEQINEALLKIQKKHGILMPVEESRPLKNKDLASVKLTEFDRNNKIIKVHDALLWTVDEKSDKNIYDQIIGMHVGEKRKIALNAEKGSSYKIELKAIKYIKYPPIDDELAKAAGNYNSLDELKSALKKDIEEEIERVNRLMYQDMIVSALLEKYSMELPGSLVKRELENIATNDKDLQEAYVLNDKEHVNGRLKQLAAYVRVGLSTRIFFDAIKTQENIVVTDDELRVAVEKMANQSKETPEHIMESLKKDDNIETVKMHLINDKILDLIIEDAQFIEEGTVT